MRRSATPPRSSTPADRSACASCARSSISSKATGTSALEQPAHRIGVLGGSFNPPHLGHLAVARNARQALGLERVLLIPVHTQPLKRHEEDPGPAQRLAMCRLAAAAEPWMAASAIEIERGGLSYTVDTLRAIHASHPDAELTLIVGADTAGTLPSWREPGALLALAGLAVAARSGSDRSEVLETIGAVGASDRPPARVRFLDMPTIDVSSSMVRMRAAAGEPIEELVGPRVADYIAEHGLYGAGARA